MDVIKFLRSDKLVADIQQYFGIQLLHIEKPNGILNNKKGGACDDSTINYKVTNKFWYYLFKFGTELGDELFYATFIPFWFWNVDGAVGRRVILVWAIVMCIGNTFRSLRYYFICQRF